MSIEKALAELTEAVQENSALLKILTSKAQAGMAEASKSSKKDDDGDDEKPKSTRSRSKKDDADDKPKTTRAKKVSVKAITDRTTEYLDVSDDDEYNERRDVVKSIVKHFGAAKMSEIAEEDRPAAMEYLEMAIRGENVDFDEDGKGRRDDDVV